MSSIHLVGKGVPVLPGTGWWVVALSWGLAIQGGLLVKKQQTAKVSLKGRTLAYHVRGLVPALLTISFQK